MTRQRSGKPRLPILRSKNRVPVKEEKGMAELKLSDIDLPDEAKAWIARLSSAQKRGLQTILNDVGPQNFLNYWKEHKADIEQLEFEFGRW
jgi:hypothetical protein